MAPGGLAPAQTGSTRRRLTRRFLGPPGSLRRWVVGSIGWLALCLVLSALTLSFYPLIFGLLADMVAFVARGALVGDEDEFNASLSRALVQAARPGISAEGDSAPDLALEPEAWFARGVGRFDGAPPPPVAEGEGEAGLFG